MTKQDVRRSVRARIGALPIAERARLSADLCRRLETTEAWRRTRTILLYASLPDEVDTAPLIAAARQQAKRVVLPAVDGDRLILRYYEASQMTTGRFSILEPMASAERLVDVARIDLAVIPGRAFTSDGLRLGRGRGYYDRLLPALHCPTVGLAFPCQVWDALPTDPWDVRLSAVLW